jgi:4-hydroxy-3-methylbut-2-enyl diphosphate reductase
MTMEDLLKSNRSMGFINYKAGKRVKCVVLSADESGIKVQIGGKKDGFIDKTDASVDGAYNAADYKTGDEFEAIIIPGTSKDKDYVSLSKKEVDIKKAEDEEAEKALSAGEFSLKMTEVVKGGLRGRLGPYTIFVPASQIRMGFVKNLEDYKDKTLRLVIMPPKEKEVKEDETAESVEMSEERKERRSKYLFASQRMILEQEKQEKEDLFWSSIHVNDIVTGKVKRFTPFGAFVNVKGQDCLAHVSELSWNKINDPSQVLTIGESYDFVVLKLDRPTGKISLGFKQLQKRPYEIAAEKFPVGSVITGRVERIFSYGAFISISEGVDGLVHVSQIAHNWIKDAGEVLKVGQEVECKIIGFEDNRITLSIKELLPAPDEVAEADLDAALSESEDADGKPVKKVDRKAKFEKKLQDAEEKRGGRGGRRDAKSDEPKEWVTGSGSASFGDLLKNLNLTITDEEEK